MIFDYYFDSYLTWNGMRVGVRCKSSEADTSIKSVLDITFEAAEKYYNHTDFEEALLLPEGSGIPKHKLLVVGNNFVFRLNFNAKNGFDKEIPITIPRFDCAEPINDDIYVNDVYYRGFVVRYENPKNGWDIENFLLKMSSVIYHSDILQQLWINDVQILIQERPIVFINSDIRRTDVSVVYEMVLRRRLEETINKYIANFDIEEVHALGDGVQTLTYRLTIDPNSFYNVGFLMVPGVPDFHEVFHGLVLAEYPDGAFEVISRTTSSKYKMIFKNTLPGCIDRNGVDISEKISDAYSVINLYTEKDGRVFSNARRYCRGRDFKTMKESISKAEDIIGLFDDVIVSDFSIMRLEHYSSKNEYIKSYMFKEDNMYRTDIDSAIDTINQLVSDNKNSIQKIFGENYEVLAEKSDNDRIIFKVVEYRSDL